MRILTEEEERGRYKIKGGIVTTDDSADRQDYNCHGFSMGVRWQLEFGDDTQGFMDGMGYSKRSRAELCDDDEVVALFKKDTGTLGSPWHTAKRLRIPSLNLYESKCGWEYPVEEIEDEALRARLATDPSPPAGLQIVHTLEAIEPVYGAVDSYWVRDTSTAGSEKRRAYLKENWKLDSFDEVEDSSALISEALFITKLVLRARTTF